MSTTSNPELVITRTFDAPRELVFKAFSEKDYLAPWWGPKGFDLNVAELSFQKGGAFLYSMTLPDGKVIWGKFVYGDIVAPESIEYVSSFSDAEGNITRNPWADTWPLLTQNLITLTENNGQTTLTIKGGPIDATDEELEVFRGGIPSMHGGFKGTFDKLEEFLAKVQG